MNIIDLREAQVRYENRLEEILKIREHLYQLRSSFVRYFTINKIRMMTINDYVAGVELPKSGFNFCYTLERQLDGLGRIRGATAFKFGIYFGRTKSDESYKFRFTSKFGSDHKLAFENVKKAIIELLEAGKKENTEVIKNNIISPMVKGKILSTYFPERYLNIFSDRHLDFFLTQLDLDSVDLINGDPIFKREVLVVFKNQDPVMKKWPVDLFVNFLYNEYPGRPPKEQNNTTDPLTDYRNPIFPPNPIPEFIELVILPPKKTSSTYEKGNKIAPKNPDYEKENRRLKKLGDRGEKIVMDLEIKRLKEAGRKDLVKKIKRVSLQSDSFGYDILSFETDGTQRIIEVKATTSKIGSANFFYTSNELMIAERSDNYFIYVVYEITSKYPKVWVIKNPFYPENKNIVKIPTNYRITINTIRS